MKHKLTSITVVRKILKTFDISNCSHTLCGFKVKRKNRLLEMMELWMHVPQCPVVGDSQGHVGENVISLSPLRPAPTSPLPSIPSSLG